MENNGRYYFALLIAVLGWGLSSTIIEFGLEYVSPFNFLFLRFFINTLIMTIFILPFKYKIILKMMKNKWVWIIGFSESFGLTSQYLGQEQLVPAGLAALLSLIFLIFVPFLAPIILDTSIRLYHMVAVGMGLLGVIFISTEGDFSSFNGSYSLLGVGLLLSAAFFYAMYIVSTSRYTTIENTNTDVFALFYIVSLIISIVSFVLSLIAGELEIPEQTIAWRWIGFLVIFSTLIAFIAYFEALKVISANQASVLLLFQIVVPFTIEFILGRRYGIWVWIGASLIVVAVLIVVTQESKSSKKS